MGETADHWQTVWCVFDQQKTGGVCMLVSNKPCVINISVNRLGKGRFAASRSCLRRILSKVGHAAVRYDDRHFFNYNTPVLPIHIL